MKAILGIDVGGSGIKGAIIDTKKGKLLTKRYRVPTPSLANPENIAHTIIKIIDHFNWKDIVGIGFPSVVKNGVICTAANIDKAFIGIDFETYLKKKTDCKIKIINDADAAGIAEMKFGIGKDQRGLVMIITIGTGIGTCLFMNGKIIPNTELGHIYLPDNKESELYASDATRQKLNLNWEEWAYRLNEILVYYENLFWPDLFILGGGISKEEEKYMKYLKIRTKIVTAQFQNYAGMIGAAIYAKKSFKNIE